MERELSADPLPDDTLPDRLKAGRGAVSNRAGRYEKRTSNAVDDGWRRAENFFDGEESSSQKERSVPPPLRGRLGGGSVKTEPDPPTAKTKGLLTQAQVFASSPSRGEEQQEPKEEKIETHLHIDTSRSVINTIDSPDLPFMRSINPYRGCEHGCIYCYARPSHGWLGYSAGLDFETHIFHKPDAPEILLREMAAKNYVPHPITLGSNTDCYQPLERNVRLTRRIIEVLAAHNHPFTIITKSALVTRDLDILAPMAQKRLVRVLISLTTLDPELSRVMEPRAAAPWKRLATIKTLARAGVPVTVMTAPLIPALNDMEMEKLLEAAWEAGARDAHYTLVRLPYELKDLFAEWLKAHRPDRASHVLSLIRDTRGGKLYDADYSQRRRGKGAYADLLAQRFALATKRIGYDDAWAKEKWEFDLNLFRAPERNGQLGFGF